MASRTCMNVLCGASASIEWKRGWALRSGDFANLCDQCGSAYDQSIFCNVFHSSEAGWRECASCGKRLHCGCIASQSLLVLLDSGGVNCISCARSSGLISMETDEKSKELSRLKVDDIERHPFLMGDQLDGRSVAKLKHMQMSSTAGGILLRHLLPHLNDENNMSVRKMKQEEVVPSVGEIGSSCLSLANQSSNGSSLTAKLDISKGNMGSEEIYESLSQTNLNIALGNPNTFPAAVIDEGEYRKTSSPLQGSKTPYLLPKPPRSAPAAGPEGSKSLGPPLRVARPPAEGRGRSQLLPRYWPRITDQELQQLSGDSNSTIVPLFEKVLSASDAGRIGRLVLPKACAEAYFPPISQPEGLPLRIQDVKGKEWVFQFRFWPNNNSRMYVLEGVTPCIQSMQLQAGDTVTFSRMDPEGKLVMGFRKASNSITTQESQPSATPNGGLSSETFLSGVFENLPIISGYSGLLQSMKGGADAHLNMFSKQLTSAAVDNIWRKNEKQEQSKKEMSPSMLVPDRKKARNIGSKSKRLLIDSHDALELRLTWEEAQDLLRPPPRVKPSIIVVEEHEFEEYEEPPVFGKRSIFVLHSTRGQEQWAQCDSCSKWRRLPVDFLLPQKWTCMENIWDQSRCSCSAPNELTTSELEKLVRLNDEFKRQKTTTCHRRIQEHESSGLDALANAAILGDNAGEGDPGTTSVAVTTKHPRHRPGCSCIVCIQPPSGKGKHKPTCTCNVCMTVKRRFKTLMMRKKKRQSEREAEIVQRSLNTWGPKDDSEVESSSRLASSQVDPSDSGTKTANELESKNPSNNISSNLAEAGKGQIDLNCNPNRDEDLQLGLARVSMTSLLQVASLPLETYLKQNGLTSLVSDQAQQASSASQLPQVTGESEGQINEDRCLSSAIQERESGGEEHCGPGLDQTQNDTQ